MTFRVDASQPFCLIRRKDEDSVLLLRGPLTRSRSLADIPRQHGGAGEERLDTISMVPFCQARERGFPVHDAGESILTIQIASQETFELREVIAALPQIPLQASTPSFDISGTDYEALIRKIMSDEIGNGRGANFVIPRACEFKLQGFTPEHALSLFRALLVHEYGAYWSYLFSDGERFFAGASPERHISARGGEVRMNPISGTFRKNDHTSGPATASALFSFLDNEKEIFELFMVVDEELKIMAEICEGGGIVVGPMLKEMSRLVHTEYLLVGKSERDVVELYRGAMFAPTVTGSPVQSAFRVIEEYESGSRGYYSAAPLLLGRDAEGRDTMDSCIAIRTFAIDADGTTSARAGATLVRNSNASEEVKETEAKIAGLLNAVRQTTLSVPARFEPEVPKLDAEELQAKLQTRNLYLSRFWFEPQLVDFNAVPALLGKKVLIIENEDNFSVMLRRMAEQMGAEVSLVSFADYSDSLPADVTIVGPGPGDPTDRSDPKMQRLRGIVNALLEKRRPFLAECLGHQILCTCLGLRVGKKHQPFQGTQEQIDLFGKRERVGFYNTFCGFWEQEHAGITVSLDPATTEIHALRGETFVGVQFHLESILSPTGYRLFREALLYLLDAR